MQFSETQPRARLAHGVCGECCVFLQGIAPATAQQTIPYTYEELQSHLLAQQQRGITMVSTSTIIDCAIYVSLSSRLFTGLVTEHTVITAVAHL